MAFPTQNPDELPRQIGDYQLLEKIGDGTLGSVHRAIQVSTNRVVALKILSPALVSDAAYMERFVSVATAAAALEHPNLAAMYEVGESNGIYFVATEFMPGDSLYRLVRAEGHLTQQIALGVCECVGGALKLAWDNARLTHGSLRPENIMLDAEGNAKLCDLGLAKDWSAESAEGAPPEVFSALNYRAPELTRPDAPPDARADIYSMGLTLYFLLTGQVPFEAASWADVMARRLSETLPDPREHAPETSAFACLLLERMLAKNPDDRYQSWDEVLRDLHLVYERKQPQAPQLPAGASVMRRTGAKIKIGGGLETATTASAPAAPPTTAAPKLSIKPSGSSPAVPASKLKLKLPSQAPDYSTAESAAPASPKLKLKLPSTPAAEAAAPTGPTLKLPSKMAPLPTLKLPSQPVAPPPAEPAFGEETAPSEFQQEAAAPSYDETQPAPPPQWSDPTVAAEAEQFQPTAASAEEVAAEPPKKKSWLLPILGLLLMLVVIVGGPWLLITFLKKPSEAPANGEHKNGATQNNINPNQPQQPKTPPEALALWREIEIHERNFPAGYDDRADKLRQFIATYPTTPEAQLAQQKLDELAPKLKGKTERLFEKTMAEISAAMKKQDFDAARKLAADAAANADLKDYKQWFDVIANGAARQIGFWDSLTNNINALKGRSFTLKGVSGFIAGVVGDRVQLEQRQAFGSSLMDIPLKSLSVAEAIALTRANNPTYNAETCLNFAWMYFAGGFERESAVMLDLAEKNGADVPAVRAAMAMLTRGVDEYAAEREMLRLRAALENRQWKLADELLNQLRDRRAATKVVQAAVEELMAIEARLDLEMEIEKTPVGTALRSYTGHTAAIFSVACSYVGKTVVSASADGTARIWDVASAQQLHTLKGHTAEIHSVAVSPDAKFVVTGSADRTVRFWDVNTGQVLTVYLEHTAEVNAVAISLDGQRIATTGNDRIIKVLRAPLGAEIRGVKISGETPMRCLALSRDGRFAAAGGNDATVRQWDLTTGRERRKLDGHTAPVLCVALAPDGNTAFTGSENGEVRQWDFSTSSSPRQWRRAHDGKVAGIALSADGKFIATAGSDGVAKVWEVATGRELRALQGHKGALRAVAFTADSRFLVTGGDDTVVKVWKLWDTDPFGLPILP